MRFRRKIARKRTNPDKIQNFGAATSSEALPNARALATSYAAEVIRPSFDDLVEMSDVSVAAAAGAELPEPFVALARRGKTRGSRRRV
jgi:hypothetical protein